MQGVTGRDVAQVFHAESRRCVATLVRLLGDIDRAEDAVQDAFSIALDRRTEEAARVFARGGEVTTDPAAAAHLQARAAAAARAGSKR